MCRLIEYERMTKVLFRLFLGPVKKAKLSHSAAAVSPLSFALHFYGAADSRASTFSNDMQGQTVSPKEKRLHFY